MNEGTVEIKVPTEPLHGATVTPLGIYLLDEAAPAPPEGRAASEQDSHETERNLFVPLTTKKEGTHEDLSATDGDSHAGGKKKDTKGDLSDEETIIEKNREGELIEELKSFETEDNVNNADRTQQKSGDNVELTVDYNAMMIRTMVIVAKTMMLLMLNKDPDFKVSGKDFGLTTDTPPDDDSEEKDKKPGNRFESWNKAVKKINNIAKKELSAASEEALVAVSEEVIIKLVTNKSKNKPGQKRSTRPVISPPKVSAKSR